MFDEIDFNHDAHKLANDNGIAITYTDKYVKGCRAKGPRNWKKVNLKNVQRCIELGLTTVNFWRG